MKSNALIRALVAMALLCTITNSLAQQLIPARFSKNPGSFSTILASPEGAGAEDGVVRIPCQAFVLVTGNLEDINCFTDMQENSLYVQEIFTAAQSGRMSPALVNGLPTRVFMTFSVWFACMESECNVLALPHDNIHAAEFGLNYFAPQAIIPGEEWYDGFAKKIQTIREYESKGDEAPQGASGRSAQLDRPAPRGSVAYILSVDVDESGYASRGKVSRSVQPLEEVAESARGARSPG